MIKYENKIVLVLLSLLSVFFSYSAIVSDAAAVGGADSYQHYQIAHWAFENPILFFDHWGKPIFTLLMSPFAFLGFTCAKLFNVALGIIASWFTYLVCKRLFIRNAWLVIILLCFMPMYFSMLNTTLTEVLCSTMLIISVYLFLCDKLLWCSILLSFLPFVRTETFILLPFFALAFILKRQVWVVPFLLCGFLLYSITGYYYYHDLLWVFTKNPYTGANDLYGHGELFDFIKDYRSIWGGPASVLISIGLIFFIALLIIQKRQRIYYYELLIIVIPGIVHLAAHSYLWWQGLGGSLGLTRVITCVMPFYSIMALRGYNCIEFPVKKYIFIRVILFSVCIITIAYVPFTNKAIIPPVRFSENDELIRNACNWMIENKLSENKVYFINSVVPLFLNKNQFDKDKMHCYFGGICTPLDDTPEGGIVFWDSHFGNNEGRLHIQTLLDDGRYKILKTFSPKSLTTVMGNYPYQLIIWQKSNEHDTTYVPSILANFDFETPVKNVSDKSITNEQHFSQNFSYRLDENCQFSPTITYALNKMKSAGFRKVIATVNMLLKVKTINNCPKLIISFERNGIQYAYNKVDLDISAKEGQWNEMKLDVTIPDSSSSADIMKAYIWEPQESCYIDDFNVKLE